VNLINKENEMQFSRDDLNPGEVYAGIILGQNGEADYHLILLPSEADSVTWAKAKAFAKKAGGTLPNRREQRLLWINALQAFQSEWYWSSEQHASISDYAWLQDFYDGSQDYDLIRKDNACRARAVRRLAI
jgi:hypothetical protein